MIILLWKVFSSLKMEAFYSQEYKGISTLKVIEIVKKYTDYYNEERIQVKLNYFSHVIYKKR